MMVYSCLESWKLGGFSEERAFDSLCFFARQTNFVCLATKQNSLLDLLLESGSHSGDGKPCNRGISFELRENNQDAYKTVSALHV